MLATLPLATAAITLAGFESAVDGHCGPSWWINRSYTISVYSYTISYTISYTNDPQKAVNRCQCVSTAVSAITQNDAVFVQWIKVKVKKEVVGMARFELATS